MPSASPTSLLLLSTVGLQGFYTLEAMAQAVIRRLSLPFVADKENPPLVSNKEVHATLVT